MHIFLDNIVFTIQRAGGVSAYWYELLKGMGGAGHAISLLNARLRPGNVFETRLDYSGYDCIRESWIPPQYLRYLPLRYTLPSAAVFHGGYMRVSPQRDVVNILTVHDFAHERRLASRFPRSLANTTQKAYGIKRADGIICISESTRRELLHFYPQTDPAKIRVIHHGITADYHPIVGGYQRETLLPTAGHKRYILYVGARRHYKNFGLALEVMEQLPEDYELVVVGGELWTRREHQELQERTNGRYHLFPSLSNADLNRLYNQAFCLLYPSAYEGFGFPPGEAMKAGCPVICGRTTAMPEVAGAAGLLVEEMTAMAILDKIGLLEQAAYRQAVVAAGLGQATLFSWEKCIQSTISFYQHCWNHKFST
ncbi:glycosyltransferase family 4 protein [Chitinophaga pendula]|uniref:glycosyltransferase family 4 protein n=1 Tax=Chitinophaga TaxID=79328 RepID=UPI000BAFFC70|nr:MULTISPECIES: glycosyltransferase family 1 protein [Chitinophaga]ASZ14200.1 hypothetical protein CK934_26235 [Chitinophaga sp. MD30]UCJ08163.1 glycosyltransferase family 4 protein [Chitinophaga pendula]